MDPHDLLRSYYFASENIPTKFQSNKPIVPGELVFAPLLVKIFGANHLNNVDDDQGSTRILLKFIMTLPSRKKKNAHNASTNFHSTSILL